MKRIILSRHAKTIQPEGMMSDFDRYLLPRGYKDPILVAEEMTKLSILPQKIVSSPAKRAVQTAEIFADRFHIERSSILLADFIYGYYSLNKLMEYLNENTSGLNCVQLIGHNPKMEELTADFTGSVYRRLPTSGSAILDFEVNEWNHIMQGSGTLVHLITAKSLRE